MPALKDISGQRFGRLEAIKRVNNTKYNRTQWLCKCDCGKEKVVVTSSLTLGLTKSCGCLHKESMAKTGKKRVKNLDGQRFGRLLVLERDYKRQQERSSNSSYWKCKCDCGNEKSFCGPSLTRKGGGTQSCGCLSKEMVAERNAILFSKNHGVVAQNAIYYRYKRMAGLRDLNFDLSVKDLRSFLQQDCFYCGSKPNNRHRNKRKKMIYDYMYNGIDRKDNKKGYSLDNCVPCCKICNRAKDVMSLKEFEEWIKSVHKKFAKKGV
ncbi:MAG: hypothetical protein HOG49_28500 [Candidatus Scalindua sp.]|jgi:hypothetical protein|nr:hypothetical protein [Candidatus Scalindua sp.]